MAKWNPLAFRPLPVTIISSLVYIALFAVLIVLHHNVPSIPKSIPYAGIDISEAWLDLKYLTDGYHPYNSKRNDVVRDWLLRRLDEILESNNASYVTGTGLEVKDAPVIIFNDIQSNLTFSSGNTSTYFEGTNIIVYVRGSDDGSDDWKTGKGSGVLVNAHYDSVSTGYGATDDGVGVVTVLQLVKYFTQPGNQPRRGFVALLNNGEEDYLNGARAFARHPISSFPHTFLNLEGAGAGGKAAIFRSTDTEVTRFYKGVSSPFGTVLTKDAFSRGVIRSQTDYIVFNGDLGMRGLDVAFIAPRARYHTDQDDTKHTTVESLWHMLSTSIHTIQGMVSDTSSLFEGESSGKGKVPSGIGSDAVWFDLLGQVFVIFELHTLFAISVTSLVVCPIVLLVTIVLLAKADKFYMFSLSTRPTHALGELRVSTGGLRGFFRFPIILILSTAGVVGLAYLITKLNPFVIYSSPYSIWSMFLSAWICLAWFFSCAIDGVRPSAFHRSYALLWLFIGGWALLVIETVYEERLAIAGGYPFLFGFGGVFLATEIALLEQFGLQTKDAYAEEHSQARSEEALYRGPRQDNQEEGAEEDEATESTSLLKTKKKTTFANYSSSGGDQDHQEEDVVSIEDDHTAYPGVFKHEQLWSENLPSSTWVLQFLLLSVFPVIVVGQIALLLTSALPQTLADGNPALPVYLALTVLTFLLVAPLGPFIHRYSYHIPTFLFMVLIATTIYNIVAFPFSGNNRLKVYFIQRVDLDSGLNTVSLMSPQKRYLDQIIDTLPSAAGQKITYIKSSDRKDQLEAQWAGLAPTVVPITHPELPPEIDFGERLSYNITRPSKQKSASIVLFGKNTRSCRLRFNSPVSSFEVQGSDYDSRIPATSDDGTTEIRLWSREWERPWNVTFQWDDQPGMDGRVVCLWNDEDGKRLIPALEEFRRFAPDWAAVTKASDGLVEGSKAFSI